MSGELGTSRRYLEQQYGDDRNLAARQSIYSYRRPRIDFYRESLAVAALQGDESILEVGCGNGRYLAALQARDHRGLVCGVDVSFGMLESARRDFGAGPLAVGDAQALPFPTGSFDVALAMHMLYHVPDRARAVAEIRRVVRPHGVALVLTNSVTHFQELDRLLLDCATATVDASMVRPRSSLAHYTVEGGAPLLESAFTDVTLHMFSGELVIDDVEPVVAYARSLGSFVVESEVDREPVLVELRRRVAETIETDGALRITTASGCFVCRG